MEREGYVVGLEGGEGCGEGGCAVGVAISAILNLIVISKPFSAKEGNFFANCCMHRDVMV